MVQAGITFPIHYQDITEPWSSTGVPNTRPTKKEQLRAWLATLEGPVTPEAHRQLMEHLRPVSEDYLRKLLRESGHPLHPLVEGVRQEDYESLERTLNALEAIYATGDDLTKSYCRRLVKEAKLHAEMAERRYPGSKTEKIEWMRLWIDNPAIFPVWAKLRRKSIETPPTQPG